VHQVAPEALDPHLLVGAHVPGRHLLAFHQVGQFLRGDRAAHPGVHRVEDGREPSQLTRRLLLVEAGQLPGAGRRRVAVQADHAGRLRVPLAPQHGEHPAERVPDHRGPVQFQLNGHRGEVTERRVPGPRAVAGAPVPAQVQGDDPVPGPQRPGQRGQRGEVATGAVQQQQRRLLPTEVADGDRQRPGVDQSVVDHNISPSESAVGAGVGPALRVVRAGGGPLGGWSGFGGYPAVRLSGPAAARFAVVKVGGGPAVR
jgi:hypothetical protein